MKQEKVNFKNSKGKNLVGILHIPDMKTDAIVIICHGFCSAKDRERLINVAEAYSKKGISALRFDFGGSGESYETEITIKNQIDDLISTIAFVKSKGYKRIGLQGESLGGLVSVLAYTPNIKTMVLWAPVTKGKDKLKEILEQEKLSGEELEEKGYLTKIKYGREYKIPKQYFEERLKVNQKEILLKIKTPILIIHGNKDDSVPLQSSKEAMNYLPRGSKLEIIDGGNHTLENKMGKVIPLSVNWFEEYLK